MNAFLHGFLWGAGFVTGVALLGLLVIYGTDLGVYLVSVVRRDGREWIP